MANNSGNEKDGDKDSAKSSTSPFSGRLAALWARIMAPETVAAADEPTAAGPPPAPVVWLLGKVQSGKSSIVRALTGSTTAEIGSGFRPCTKTARIYDYPETTPVLRFLDTRGVGEIDYDPAADIAYAEHQAHLMVIVMRALDHAQEAVLKVAKQVRRQQPEWPIVVAQTCLHEAYPPGKGHILPYPFDHQSAGAVPADLRRSLAHQQRLFETVAGTGPLLFVPVDFTHEDDGYEPRDFGLEALENALIEAAPAAMAAALATVMMSEDDARAASAHPHILGYACAAGAADAVPAAGAVAVPGVQAKLLHSIGRIYGITWDRHTMIEFGGCLGSGIVTRILASFGIRQITKLVPVYGQTIGAAAAAATSFATTYALGKAACYFLARRRAGGTIDPAEVARTYAESLEAALKMAKEDPTARSPGRKADP